MKIRIFLITVMCMMLLAIGMNTRNIAANNFSVIPVSDVEMIADVMKSVVKVIHPDFPNLPATGFYIGNGIVVTAGHVASTGAIEKVVFEDGSEYEIIKRIVCPDYDCGFLIISIENTKLVLKFDDEVIQRGDELFILGNPRGCIFVVSKGIMSGYTDCDGFFGNIKLLAYDLETADGSSGSPVVDKEGEVVAVNVGGNGTGYNVGVCKDDILRALEQAGLSVE